MTIFLRQLGRFAAGLTLYLGLGFAVNQWALHGPPYRPPEPPSVLIAGASHMRLGVNPAILGGAVNVAQNGEPYYLTLGKLRYLLDSLPEVETVLLGYSPHDLSTFNDHKLLDRRWAWTMFERFDGFVDWKSLDGVPIGRRELAASRVRNRLFISGPAVRALVRRVEGRPAHYPFIGEYEAFEGSRLSPQNLAAVVERHFRVNGAPAEVSAISVEYLRRIVRLCQARGVELVLVTTPLHPSYRPLVPPTIAQAWRDLADSLAREPGVRVLDFTTLIDEDRYFANCDHLNTDGAALLSRRLRDLLHPGLPAPADPGA